MHKHFRRFRFRFCPRQALRLPEHHCLLVDQLVAILELVHVVLDFALQRVADGNRIGVQVVAAEQDTVLVDEEYRIFSLGRCPVVAFFHAAGEVDRHPRDDRIAVGHLPQQCLQGTACEILCHLAAALFVKVLKAEGFQVEEGICGIPTAFSASFGSGGPVIGLLAEYDALSGLSQAAGSTAYHELVKGGSGHGCGHNLLGAGAMAAAIGLKHYLTQTGKSGTVILYGCPGEEGVASKAYMAREGLWYGLDAALTWHPGDSSEVTTGSTNSCIQMIYTFHGLASQASTAPERGRSALDAVELMNVGVQFLREHMPRDARVHYSILDAGGVSPNVVQHQASVLYMIRSNFVKDCMALHQRVDKIAQGAALMTDTTIERRFVDGLSDTVCNHALEQVLYDNFSQLGVPPCTAEEHAFMEALSATYEGRDIPGGVGAENDPAFAEKVKAMQTGHFNDFLMPLYQGPAFNAGSTDVGDVSYQCPTAQIHVAVWPNHVPCHSWQVVSCNKTPMAHKATVHAGKVLCAAAIDLLEQPALLEAAKAEFRQRTAGGYTCPIPPDAVPAPLEL